MPEQPILETILRTGQIVAGQYRVDRLIAKGGMAAVWAGVNEHTGKRVALKVILHSFAANGDAAELFRREALAASKINHPSVVNIFDVIDHEGMTCIVMELLEGETLGNYLARNGPLSLETTAALLLPAMRGVAAANAQGVVHRDLKPGNIFLCNDSDGRLLTTKVLDFGISVVMRRVGDTSTAREPLAMFGTPAYMAPEAIELSPSIDGRADVYGFGVLFFEALTGKLPFLGQPGTDLLQRVLTEPAPKLTLYRPDLPSAIVGIVDCALAKNPNDRFPDMTHLIRATEACLQALPPMPRALTPDSGLFSIPLAQSNPAYLPQLADEKQPPGRTQRSETRALYSLANESPRASHGATTGERTKLSPAVPGARTARKHLYSQHPPRRRVAIGAAVVVFLVAMAWVTVPASSGDSSASTPDKHSESVARRENVRADSQPAPPPTGETQTPDEPAAGSGSRTESLGVDLATRAAEEPSFHAAAPHPLEHVAPARSTSRKRRATDVPVHPDDPLAGRLSPSDF
jgi:serine/threonine protein kinase